jgi:hypothetical protein
LSHDSSPLISPELVLVDPVLAEVARGLLPDIEVGPVPAPTATRAAPAADEFPLGRSEEPTVPAEGLQGPRRRRGRGTALALAGICVSFAAGAAFARLTMQPGERVFLGDAPAQSASQAPATPAGRGREEPQPQSVPPPPPATSATGGERRRDRPATSTGNAPPAPAQQSRGTRFRRQGTAPAKAKAKARRARRTPAPNVLGVIVRSDPNGVLLSWRPPHGSHHVVILRGRGTTPPATTVVYRGRSDRFRDRRVRTGLYTYVIVNYDGTGNASSGIPTVVAVQRRAA